MKADTQTIDILLLGSGGREHALAAKLAASPRAGKLYIAPGNGGTASCGENVVLDDCDPAAVAAFAQSHGCGLVVIGPEAPLVAGVADAVRAAGIPCFGPGPQLYIVKGYAIVGNPQNIKILRQLSGFKGRLRRQRVVISRGKYHLNIRHCGYFGKHGRNKLLGHVIRIENIPRGGYNLHVLLPCRINYTLKSHKRFISSHIRARAQKALCGAYMYIG